MFFMMEKNENQLIPSKKGPKVHLKGLEVHLPPRTPFCKTSGDLWILARQKGQQNPCCEAPSLWRSAKGGGVEVSVRVHPGGWKGVTGWNILLGSF